MSVEDDRKAVDVHVGCAAKERSPKTPGNKKFAAIQLAGVLHGSAEGVHVGTVMNCQAQPHTRAGSKCSGWTPETNPDAWHTVQQGM
jgi:hypothetical protein